MNTFKILGHLCLDETLGCLDYFVFGGLLLASALIGMYYACSGGKQKSEAEWLAGNQALAWFPTSLSLVASFISAITLLGIFSPFLLYFCSSDS